ncbi:MAG: HEAT repeat domain-containing protein [Blastocatellia bacterium]
MLSFFLIVLIVVAIVWWASNRKGLSFNERQYLKNRGYAADAALDAGPPITKDTRLLSLIESLGDLSPYARHRAAEDLARMCQLGGRDERMLPSLLVALDDSNASVRSAAANALLQLGSPEAIAPLKRRLESEESIHVRASLQRAIEQLQA